MKRYFQLYFLYNFIKLILSFIVYCIYFIKIVQNDGSLYIQLYYILTLFIIGYLFFSIKYSFRHAVLGFLVGCQIILGIMYICMSKLLFNFILVDICSNILCHMLFVYYDKKQIQVNKNKVNNVENDGSNTGNYQNLLTQCEQVSYMDL